MSNKPRAAESLLLFAVIILAAVSTAAQDTPWTGESVLPTRLAKEITLTNETGDKQVVYPLTGPWPYKIREERDGRLRIFDGTHEGWADKNNFVLPRDAVEYFTRRLATNPRDTFALSMRAGAWQEKKEYDKALADYDECIRLHPISTTFNNRGVLWNIKKEPDKAVADFTEALRLDPNHMISYVNRGNVWREKKEYDKAIQDYNEATRLEPKYASAYYHRGYTYNLKKDYDSAIRELSEYIRLDSNNFAAFYERGSALRNKKEYELAINDFNEAIRLSPTFALAFQTRALAYRNMKQYDKAIQDYDESIRLSPKVASAFSAFSWLLSSCPDEQYRNGARALQLATTAYELSGKQADYLDALGAAHAQSGNFDEAIKCVKQAMESTEYAKHNGTAMRKRLQLYEQKQPWRLE